MVDHPEFKHFVDFFFSQLEKDSAFLKAHEKDRDPSVLVKYRDTAKHRIETMVCSSYYKVFGTFRSKL